MLRKKLALMLACTFVMTGCGKYEYKRMVIENEPYAKTEFSGVKVKVGDLTPSFQITLMQENMQTENYGVSNENLIPERVYVDRGDKVKDGQLLASFKSDELDKAVEEKNNEIDAMLLQLEHYNRLMAIDSKLDYKDEVENLNKQIEINRMYIEEYEEKLKAYQIVSTMDGTVTDINQDLACGFLTSTKGLIRVTGGTGRFIVNTREDYEFIEGTVYEAEYDGSPYEMKIVEVETETTPQGKKNTKLIFEPLDDLSAIADNAKFDITINKETQRNVVYIEKKAIRLREGGEYVLIINELGFLESRIVELGDLVGDYYIITSGLNGDEEVVLK